MPNNVYLQILQIYIMILWTPDTLFSYKIPKIQKEDTNNNLENIKPAVSTSAVRKMSSTLGQNVKQLIPVSFQCFNLETRNPTFV